MKKFEIKVKYKNGYTVESDIQAGSFAEACMIAEKRNMGAVPIIGFELVDFKTMQYMPALIPTSENHGLKFSLTGYKRSLYQGWVVDGIKSGMDVQEAIDKAQAQVGSHPQSPHYNENEGSQLAEEYFDAQNRAEAIIWLTSLNGGQ